MRNRYDVIVIGGGHAGLEAANAAANAGRGALRVALVTMDPSKIGTMSCNPAIGGLAKGQIVREIDALGGLMGRAIDATGIQFRVLNMSRGPAVRGPRAQADKYAYAAETQMLLSQQNNIDVIAGTVDELVNSGDRITGVRLPAGSGVVSPTGEPVHRQGAPARALYPSTPADNRRAAEPVTIDCSVVVITTGTFMRGLMHTGEHKTIGGRQGEGASTGLSGMLRELGFDLGRLKTGTPPRLAAETIRWEELEPQQGDCKPVPFSHLSPENLPSGRFPVLRQVACHVTSTTDAAHEIIRQNLHRAPMYAGEIDAECGPRYCPSIEDKVVRFRDRDSHHVFLEPESLHTNEIYCNGISTSLPQDVQERIVHLMPGCEDATILKWGYAVEYDVVWPNQIDATGMTKLYHGLFLAGQINGTSGYEEAGGQGLVAGLNAARLALDQSPVRIGRDQAYIGVMFDDLVTKTPREPYRMFTSRAEFRLILRADNADTRLTPLGRELGLVDDDRWLRFCAQQEEMDGIRRAFTSARVDGKRLDELARRPGVAPVDLLPHLPEKVNLDLLQRVMTETQYAGYIDRQRAEIKRQTKAEQQPIPEDLPFHTIPGIRNEALEALLRFRPRTMGQAGRLAGMNPADLTILSVAIRKHAAAGVSLDALG